jgi:hypothetical protein
MDQRWEGEMVGEEPNHTLWYGPKKGRGDGGGGAKSIIMLSGMDQCCGSGFIFKKWVRITGKNYTVITVIVSHVEVKPGVAAQHIPQTRPVPCSTQPAQLLANSQASPRAAS